MNNPNSQAVWIIAALSLLLGLSVGQLQDQHQQLQELQARKPAVTRVKVSPAPHGRQAQLKRVRGAQVERQKARLEREHARLERERVLLERHREKIKCWTAKKPWLTF